MISWIFITIQDDDTCHGDPEESTGPFGRVDHGKHDRQDEDDDLHQNSTNDAGAQTSPTKKNMTDYFTRLALLTQVQTFALATRGNPILISFTRHWSGFRFFFSSWITPLFPNDSKYDEKAVKLN